MTESLATHNLLQLALSASPQSVDMCESTYPFGDVETVPPARQESWTYGYVVSGGLSVEHRGRQFTCRQGDSVMIDGRYRYTVTGLDRSPARVVWFTTFASTADE